MTGGMFTSRVGFANLLDGLYKLGWPWFALRDTGRTDSGRRWTQFESGQRNQIHTDIPHTRTSILKQRNWKRIAAWTTAGFLVAAAGLMVGLFALLHSPRFHEYLLRTAQQKASDDALGVPVRIRDFAIHLSTVSPSVDIYDLVVDGASPYQNQPLLQADHLRLGIRITSLVHRQWNLGDVVMDHPVAHILVDPRGVTNLPREQGRQHRPSKRFRSRRSARYVQPGRVLLQRSQELDRRRPARSRISIQLQSDSEALFRRIELSRRTHSPAGFQSRRSQPGSGIRRYTGYVQSEERGTLTSGTSQVKLTATLDNYTNPRVQATYEASLNPR